jgi:hypothetical protein
VEQKANSVIRSLKEGHFEQDTQTVLNELVHRGLQSLRDHGFSSDASLYELDWTQHYSDFLLRSASRNLGDHRPLSQWLTRFHEDLEAKIGKIACRFSRLHDIKILNFAIPVVFDPSGYAANLGAREYQKHFVPFAGTVTFWSSNISCRAALPLPASIGCGPASEVAQFFVENWVAPGVSDKIYQQAQTQRQKGSISFFSSKRLVE